MMDASPPSFHLLEEFDDNNNFITNPHKCRAAGISCDGQTFYDDPTCLPHPDERTISSPQAPNHSTSQSKHMFDSSPGDESPDASINIDNQQDNPVFDKTPEAGLNAAAPLAATDINGRLLVLSSQESPITPEVEITGVKNFNVSCSKMAKDVDSIYNETGISCFTKCQRIGFKLGSSSTGKEPRRPRRIIQPNSYYRNFQINHCNVKFIVTPEDLLAYDCILFYASHHDYASNEVINYDNVRVSYQQLATLRRSNKVSIDKFVINALCRKLFKDKHPKDSRRHFFFSTVGDFLMKNEWNHSFLYDICMKCFNLANGCFKFESSDYMVTLFSLTHSLVRMNYTNRMSGALLYRIS
ncbi:uncharacterized protein LOC120678514 isoform X2 [Panicum virgatum]|uniref:uncharacterized protein LOC120678514 isoform X2 n=1 Tax=Panicum virgatum TaxID=38727 RepID=UPI0019D510B4|nr:uncharacterized protein LOC120678514 isoform X2 [Panicum virgatum]